MKKKGVTLIELIVVLALLAIVLPLTYSIYLNGIKLSNYISDNVNVQADGSLAINQINQDLRLAKYTSNSFEKDSDHNYQIKYLNRNFYDVNEDEIKINNYKPIYYMEYLPHVNEALPIIEGSQSILKAYIYATTPPDAAGYYDVYKLFLTLMPKPVGNAMGKTVSLHSTLNIKPLTNSNVSDDFGILTSATYMDEFENLAFNVDPIYKGRDEIMIDADPLVDKHYIVLGCFKYNSADEYVYYMHDITGEKSYANLGDRNTVPADYYIFDNKKVIIENVKNFSINHSGITFNIQFDKKIRNTQDYHFDVNVNPIYLGGGD